MKQPIDDDSTHTPQRSRPANGEDHSPDGDADRTAREAAGHTPLPVDAVLPELRETLAKRPIAVLQAPPGAGKTTRVPLALLGEPWLEGRKILILEPRRLATRAAARRMAETLGEDVGQTVGYRVRMDTRVGPRTQIEVVTEGVLTRLLQADPALEDVGLVVFDEFHERSLHADLGLALTLQAREILREDLRVLVMSATLDGERVAALLGEDTGEPAPIVTAEGRQYPVETRFFEPASGGGEPGGSWRTRNRIEPVVVSATLDALDREDGDILVFLPGTTEIRRTAEALGEILDGEAHIYPLHGGLPRSAQDRAIAPSAPGERKIVLATSIAETSLTIEGVRVVIDSGLMRVPRFSPRTGMSRLETVPVTRDSADQRRGRAGRVAPGVGYRLWRKTADARLSPHATPEILAADLAPLALELAAWGTSDPRELRWLDPPPTAAYAQAQELLRTLGAIDADGTITDHGRRMARLPAHPRLAHMLLEGQRLGLATLACDLAALLSERDIFRTRRQHRSASAPSDVDLRLRLEVLDAARSSGRIPRSAYGHDVHRGGVRRAHVEAREWRRRLRAKEEPVDVDAAGLLLAFAFPDRIAQRRPAGEGRFLLRNGRGASLAPGQPLAETEWIVAAELDDRGRESHIFLAAPVAEAEILEHFDSELVVETVVEWDEDARAVSAQRRTALGAITVQEAPLRDPDPEAVTAALLEGIEHEGLRVLPWGRAASQLRERLLFLRRHDDRWPDVSEEALLESLDEWLAPWVQGMRRLDDLRRLNLTQVLESLLSWEQRAALDEEAPTRITVPSGSKIRIDYSDPDAPVLAVKLQELFGLETTPRIAGGRVPLTLHLLSPAQRPVQVTRDLANFWRETYFEVRKDMRGRYPKHPWPDDPLAAQPTRRTRRRRRR